MYYHAITFPNRRAGFLLFGVSGAEYGQVGSLQFVKVRKRAAKQGGPGARSVNFKHKTCGSVTRPRSFCVKSEDFRFNCCSCCFKRESCEYGFCSCCFKSEACKFTFCTCCFRSETCCLKSEPCEYGFCSCCFKSEACRCSFVSCCFINAPILLVIPQGTVRSRSGTPGSCVPVGWTVPCGMTRQHLWVQKGHPTGAQLPNIPDLERTVPDRMTRQDL